MKQKISVDDINNVACALEDTLTGDYRPGDYKINDAVCMLRALADEREEEYENEFLSGLKK